MRERDGHKSRSCKMRAEECGAPYGYSWKIGFSIAILQAIYMLDEVWE